MNTRTNKNAYHGIHAFIVLLLSYFPWVAWSSPLNLPDSPLFIDGSKTALVQLIVERDNKLFFEAYPTYEDINGDGVLDTRYDPANIDYYGYFDSSFCYTTVGSVLEATSLAKDKRCIENTSSWSGDFLNYVTMTRMDVMRKSMYGGKRSVDTEDLTVLRRAFVPWENHTWGIEYTSVAVDGFNIADYTPYSLPTNGKRHLFATNNFINKGDVPYLRVRTNSGNRIWEWVDKERTQGDGSSNLDLVLDVRVCKPGFVEADCKEYPSGAIKPTGLLHEYGENNAMYFSLLTGSYENNKQGGVLRQSMVSFGETEVDLNTGVFESDSGIIRTLDAIQIPNDYRSSTVQSDCGWIRHRPFNNGECRAWGNPVAEMMYEGMRYLAGTKSPTPEFFTTDGMDAKLNMPVADWDNPYSADQPYSQCSSAYQLVISDPSPSFDGDELPGSDFSDFKGSNLGDLHVGELADLISGNEDILPGVKFIGEVSGVTDGSPSPKMVKSFRSIRGQSPEAPHREGSYYASSVAYYGHQNDLQPLVNGKQNVGNFTLALGSPLPTIDIDVGGRKVSIAPFAKTVGGCGYPGSVVGDYSPTNAIVGFVVEEISDTSGSFRVSFEDMEQGADNDMDALSRYTFKVSNDKVNIEVDSLAASGCLIQHMGYTVSGTSADGVYLVVRDKDTQTHKDVDFKLDVPPGSLPGTDWADKEALPLLSNNVFYPSGDPAAEALESPLWFASKWGGFEDINGDGIPQDVEWDSNGDGEPDNYFKVTDPSKMSETMRSVFNQITEASATSTSVGVSSGSLSSGSRVYEASFQSGKWYGDLVAREISANGVVSTDIEWDANLALAPLIKNDKRKILTYKPSLKTGIPFRWPANPAKPADHELDLSQVESLSRDPITNLLDDKGASRLAYLRGTDIPGFRERKQPLGDIVHSSPQLVGPPVYFYPDNWGAGAPESGHPYSDFGRKYADRGRVIYVGANDGMLHAFDAGKRENGKWVSGSGKELFSYVPSTVYKELPELTSTPYSHKYFVDATPRVGDAFINDKWRTVLVGGLRQGGQGVYALDITDVNSISEAQADKTVLWEFSDSDDADMGYSYTSPLIARMHNGRWAAIFGNGFNSTESDSNSSTNGKGAIFIVDLETGKLVKKMLSNAGRARYPNGISAPTAVDLDHDNIVDIIYAGDLHGRITKYDVRSSNPASWSRISDQMFRAFDQKNEASSITSEIAVGTHPSGKGVMLYFGSGKYLEPGDIDDVGSLDRIYALWDKDPYVDPNLLGKFRSGRFVKQKITSEENVSFDTDGDGSEDLKAFVRKSTREPVDWTKSLGWYMDLNYPSYQGERVISAPILREDKLLVSTLIPSGNACEPTQLGWLMVLDAATGAMPKPPIDLNNDGVFTDTEVLSGIQGISNPLASPTVVATQNEDIILTSTTAGNGSESTTLDASVPVGRMSWRELEP